jgi:VCBS repeat protein
VNRLAPTLILGAALLAAYCAAPPAPRSAQPPTPPTPTPSTLSRANPNIVEEDEFHIVERMPKSEFIKVDEHHIRHPLIGRAVEFYKEDDKYYYVYSQKRNEETEAIDLALTKAATPPPTAAPAPNVTPTPSGPPLSDFEDLLPPREGGRIRLEPVAATGLPQSGLWRASFVVADVNGDKIPDIIAPPSRLGDSRLHVWIGNGKGGFTAWPLQFVEDGQPVNFTLDYGGVAVGDIDRDGRLDIVAASHSGGLVSLFGAGGGTFRVVRAGLPTRNFSAQAIALADVDGDGKLDIIASTDTVTGRSDSQDQVRVYLNRGGNWEYKLDGLAGGFYSNCLHAWDFDRDGRADILTASNFIGALTLLWRNLGNGQFEPVRFPAVEIYSYHFATAPGTFGRQRASAFADAYQMITNKPQEARATGITVYSFEKGNWSRHRVWRKKAGQSIQYALAMGDLDGDGLDDVVFADSEVNRLRVFFQKPDGSFAEMAEKDEPALDSVGQWIELADVNGDGRLDVILSKTVASYRPSDQGGWSVYLNRR